MIADKTSTSKSTVHRTIQLLNSEEVNEEVYDFKKQLRYHFVLFHSLQNPFITLKKISKYTADFEFKMSESPVSRIFSDLGIKSLFQRPKKIESKSEIISITVFKRNSKIRIVFTSMELQ